MTGNAAKDASTKCKQQHGEKIIEKKLAGRVSEPKRSALCAGFCWGYAEKPQGSGNYTPAD